MVYVIYFTEPCNTLKESVINYKQACCIQGENTMNSAAPQTFKWVMGHHQNNALHLFALHIFVLELRTHMHHGFNNKWSLIYRTKTIWGLSKYDSILTFTSPYTQTYTNVVLLGPEQPTCYLHNSKHPCIWKWFLFSIGTLFARLDLALAASRWCSLS